jgi:pyrroline-5-carboxylate reductase
MESYKLGILGAGVMGEAIAGGALRAGVIRAADVFVYDIDENKLKNIADTYTIQACKDAYDLIAISDIVLAAVKPAVFQRILETDAQALLGKALISIVAGWNSAKILKHLPSDTRLLCVMPNMAAACGEAMSVLASNNTLSPGELQFALRLFGSFGETELLDDRLFDIVTGLSGSGPAFALMFMEAMMQAGIYNGLPAKTARKLAAQTVLGAAKALKMSEKHPAELRDSVCTPGGTTIEGVQELERSAFTGAVMSAVDKSAKKYKQMVNG